MSLSRKRLYELLMACLACTAIVLLAGTALAGEQEQSGDVPDDDFDIEDDNDPDATGALEAQGDEYDVSANVECAPASTSNGADGTTVFIGSTHPDEVKLKKEKADVGQSQKTNLPEVRVRTGGGTGTINARLTCEKASVEGTVKTNKSPDQGQVKAKAKKCVCNPNAFGNNQDVCDAHDARLPQVAEDCDGLDSIKGDIDGTEIKSIKMKVKGDATT